MKTKIPWADKSLNITWGCKRKCSKKTHGFDCYARNYARRFGKYLGTKKKYPQSIINKMVNFDPVLFPDWNEIFDRTCKGKPSRIFVNSMSDVCYWPGPWVGKIITKIKRFPQHSFMFLTKNIHIYENYDFPLNCLLGVTVTKEVDRKIYWITKKLNNKTFVSIEPILSSIKYINNLEFIDWVIVGAMTGPGRKLPKLEWIVDIMNYCHFNDIPLFLKDNLKDVWGKSLLQEYPG